MNLTTPGIFPAGEDTAEKARQLQRQKPPMDGANLLSEKQRQQARKVAQDFEGLFIGMMMKSMRETVGKDPITNGGHGEDVYRSILDQQYVDAAVKRGGFGLAKQIEREIIRQESKKVSGRIVDSHE